MRFHREMTSATSPIILKWDPKSLEIRTLTVERLLEPLVTQVREVRKHFTVTCVYVPIVTGAHVYHDSPQTLETLRREQIML